MIGPRIGAKVGPRAGAAIGVGVDQLAPSASTLAGVAQDATSSKYVPANSTQWTTVMSAAGIGSGNPSLLWLMQEASGTLADSIGTNTGSTTGATYQQAITGWARKGITIAEAAANGISALATNLPDVSTTSLLVISYAQITTPAATPRTMHVCGTTTRTFMEVDTTPHLVAASDTGSTVTGTANPTGAVRPFITRINRSVGPTYTIFSDQEKLAPTFPTGLTGKGMSLGVVATPVPATYTYTTAFFGAAAELSDAQVRTLLQTLGWTVSW